MFSKALIRVKITTKKILKLSYSLESSTLNKVCWVNYIPTKEEKYSYVISSYSSGMSKEIFFVFDFESNF